MTNSPVADLFGYIVALGLVSLFWQLLFSPRPQHNSAQRRRSGSSVGGDVFLREQEKNLATASIAVRTQQATVDPCDHPYANYSLDGLLEHLYERHFEVLNTLAERDPSPKTWRRNHAEDHGVVVR